MTNHLDLSDAQFLKQFQDCNLASTLFTHEAHLRLAWLNIQEYGIENATNITCNQITNYVTHLGAKDKFNMTLTVAATKAVNHFIQKSNSNNFVDFIQEFPRLNTNFKDLMAAHYGFDIYQTQEAKAKYLEPDLLPF